MQSCLMNMRPLFLTPGALLAARGVRCWMARLLEGSPGSMQPGRHQGEDNAHRQRPTELRDLASRVGERDMVLEDFLEEVGWRCS